MVKSDAVHFGKKRMNSRIPEFLLNPDYVAVRLLRSLRSTCNEKFKAICQFDEIFAPRFCVGVFWTSRRTVSFGGPSIISLFLFTLTPLYARGVQFDSR